MIKFLRERVVSSHPFHKFRLSIQHFAAKYPLTYKIPLSYTLTFKKEILISLYEPGQESPR
jgi:hypothetical protein